LTILLILFSPLPETLLGAFLLLHDSQRQPYGQLYDMTGYLQQAKQASQNARLADHEKSLLRQGIHTPDELMDYLQQESRVTLPKKQFLSILRWLPHNRVDQLIPQDQLLNLLYFSDWSQVTGHMGSSRVAFDFQNDTNASLHYAEMPEEWLKPSWKNLELISRVRNLDMVSAFETMKPQEFLLRLDSLSTQMGWKLDPQFLIDMAGDLREIVLTSPDELLLVSKPDSLYEIWRYEIPHKILRPFWWRP